MKNSRKYGLVAVVLVLVLSLVGCSAGGKGTAGGDNTVTIGGKNFTEQDILVYLMAGVIEAKTDLKVETKPWLGGTLVVSKALDRGDIDLYAEYTGTALTVQLEQPPMNDPDAVYDKVSKEYKDKKKITWLKPFGFNNTYTLAMGESEAQRLGIESFSDLTKQAPNLTLVSEQEFLERDDGYKGLQKTYNMNFKETKGMDAGLMYSAVKDGKADVCDAFATDGRIVAFNLRVLKDDKQFFPPYYAAPVVRDDTLAKHPELKDALNSLAGKLDDKTMQQLNAKVDLENRKSQDVANEWLKAQGLI
ncbi:glycine betaine ABC transporter substrate-binding protein [Paradesulfitobacterium ferrireducens]|uniref:glycine betaine ABC transporter substrate-binding protein n=1 Tax=Paradesulfitobacterium ferrireducens TaxID=2816476 RepID=UPI001A8D502B|nr:glycine betaine ABC transporter substrate-binding protein [Paradesulfitobacterium ferrireducens]